MPLKAPSSARWYLWLAKVCRHKHINLEGLRFEVRLKPCRYVRFGCFVDGVEDFDAAGFRLASGEAVALDPQTRIALEQTQVRNAAISLGNLDFQRLPVKS